MILGYGESLLGRYKVCKENQDRYIWKCRMDQLWVTLNTRLRDLNLISTFSGKGNDLITHIVIVVVYELA